MGCWSAPSKDNWDNELIEIATGGVDRKNDLSWMMVTGGRIDPWPVAGDCHNDECPGKEMKEMKGVESWRKETSFLSSIPSSPAFHHFRISPSFLFF